MSGAASAEQNKGQERIGGVTLDYTYYPGEDFYCDGAVEDEILEIVKSMPREEYDRVIRERRSWPVLYHLSRERGNIVDWLPFTGREKVLEIGAGPGAVTSTLARRCGSVTCVELSRKRSLINAYRNRDRSNVTILVGNFEDIEPHLDRDYDYIFLIGVLEYAASYIHSAEDPFLAELQRILSHVRKTADGAQSGRVVVAIENRLGLKYFAGCREDHSGRFFDGIESYENGPHPATTFSRPGLEKLFCACGAQQYSFYYPYPDYKFMKTLYSDRRLPEGAELSDNIRNFDRDRLLLFDEKKAYDGITGDGLFPIFSNSYEVVLGPSLPVAYCKFSGDRAAGYRIRTALFESVLPETAKVGSRTERHTDHEQMGQFSRDVSWKKQQAASWAAGRPCGHELRKYPLSEEARAHVQRLLSSGEKLQKRFDGQVFWPAKTAQPENATAQLMQRKMQTGPAAASTNSTDPKNLHAAAVPCHAAEDGGVAFDFVPGRTLESLLDEAIKQRDGDRVLELLHQYVAFISLNSEDPCADADMTFANIMCGEDTWTAIDYEWEVDEAIAPKTLLSRALVCYEREDPSRSAALNSLLGENWKERELQVTAEDLASAEEAEDAFQEKVTGGALSLDGLRAQMNAGVIRPVELQTEEEKAEGRRRNREEELRQQKEAYEKSRELTGVKVYYDTGKGYNENETLEIGQLYGQESMLSFDVPVAAGVRGLRIDPASVPCVVMLREMFIMEYPDCGLDIFRKYEKTDGSSAAGGAVLFATNDPWYSWEMTKIRRKLPGNLRGSEMHIHVTLQMTGIPGTMAEMISKGR